MTLCAAVHVEDIVELQQNLADDTRLEKCGVHVVHSSSLELELLLLLLHPFQPCLYLCLNIFLGFSFFAKAAPASAVAPTASPVPRVPAPMGSGMLDLGLCP